MEPIGESADVTDRGIRADQTVAVIARRKYAGAIIIGVSLKAVKAEGIVKAAVHASGVSAGHTNSAIQVIVGSTQLTDWVGWAAQTARVSTGGCKAYPLIVDGASRAVQTDGDISRTVLACGISAQDHITRIGARIKCVFGQTGQADCLAAIALFAASHKIAALRTRPIRSVSCISNFAEGAASPIGTAHTLVHASSSNRYIAFVVAQLRYALVATQVTMVIVFIAFGARRGPCALLAGIFAGGAQQGGVAI